MGVSIADADNDGDDDLVVLNLMREGATLFHQQRPGVYSDVSLRTKVHALTADLTGFGAGWADFDNDGRLDLFLANGSVTRREEQRGQPRPFREQNVLLRAKADGAYELAWAATPEISRGAAFGDLDNDGCIDAVVNNNGGPARIYRNEFAPQGDWLIVDGLRPGERVTVELARGGRLVRTSHTDGSYLSASDSRAHFGLPPGSVIERVRAELPGQPARILNGVPPNRVVKFESAR
jgi:hypothetical protein